MFNALQHIVACDKFPHGTNDAYLSINSSLCKNLIFCIAEAAQNNFAKTFNGKSLPLNFLHKRIDDKVIFIFNYDDKLNGNFRLAAEAIRSLNTIYFPKIFAHCDKIIFQSEFPENTFYYIYYNYEMPDFKKGILFSHSLQARLKTHFNFSLNISSPGNFYFLQNGFKKKVTDFFGREKEIKILQRNYNRLKSELSGINQNSILINGEPGIGKTSLVNHYFNSRYCKNCFYAENDGTRNSYGHFVSLMKKILNDNTTVSSFRALSVKIKDIKVKKNFISSIPDLIELMQKAPVKNSGGEKNENYVLAIRNFVCAYSSICSLESSPFVIALDDVQWADSQTIKTINFILEDFHKDFERNYSLQFIFIHRTGYKIGIKQDIDEKEEICLDSLEREAAKKYIASLLAANHLKVSERKKNELLQKSGGNPLFIQEMIDFIKENKNNIPDSVKEIIKMRLELLPEKLSMFLKIASASGKEIDIKVVEGVLNKLNFNSISEEELSILIQNNFIVVSDKEIFFNHDLISEGIYESISSEEKKIIHSYTGFEIEKIYSEKIERYYYALAYHFTKAGNKEKIVEYIEKSGDRAKEEWDLEKARGYYERYLNESCKSNSPKKSEIQLKLAEILRINGEYDYSERILTKQIKNFKEIRDEENLFEAYLIKSDILYYRAKYKKALKVLFKINLNSANNNLVIKTYSSICKSLLKIAEYDRVLRYAEKLLRYSKINKSEKGIERAYNFQAMVYRYRGDFAKARDYFEKNLDMLLILKNKIDAANTLSKIGSTYFYEKDLNKAMQYFKSGYEMCKQVSNYSGALSCLSNMGIINMEYGRYANSLTIFTKLYAQYQKQNNKLGVSQVLGSMGILNLKLKKFTDALNYFDKKMVIDKKINNTIGLSCSYTNLGALYLKQKKFQLALKFFKKQLLIDKKLGNLEGIKRGVHNISLCKKEM